jgi:hypothetical protein
MGLESEPIGSRIAGGWKPGSQRAEERAEFMPAATNGDPTPKLQNQVERLNDSVSAIVRIGTFLVVAAFGGVGSVIWLVHRATQVEDAVIELQKTVANIESNLKETQKEIKVDVGELKTGVAVTTRTVEERSARLQESLARIEKSLAQVSQDRSKGTR